MTTDFTSINEAKFEELLSKRRVKAAKLLASKGGFLLQAMVGGEHLFLEAKRGNLRMFRKLETGAKYLYERGLMNFSVDISHFNDVISSHVTREDSSARLTAAHEALNKRLRSAIDQKEVLTSKQVGKNVRAALQKK
ncbi:MAG: hypothetical protein RR619_11150, partial [Raoultibacter sp.]